MALRLHDTLANLKQLQGRQIEQLTLRLEGQIEIVKRSCFERLSQQIHGVFDDYRQLVRDTPDHQTQSWIQVLAALSHPLGPPTEEV